MVRQAIIVFILFSLNGCTGKELVYTPANPPSPMQPCTETDDPVCEKSCNQIIRDAYQSNKTCSNDRLQLFREAIDCKSYQVEAERSKKKEWEAYVGTSEEEN